MSGRVARRAAVSLVLAGIVLGLAATVALAWNAQCSASGDACVWRHGGFGVPLAAQSTNDNTYTNDNYPNTQTNMNDDVSSVRNKFDVRDVIWYFNADWDGTSLCVDHESSVGVLGSHNDEYTSHLIVPGASC